MPGRPATNEGPSRWQVALPVADYLGLLSVLGVLILVFGFQSEHFLSVRTFTTLANQIPALTVIAVGTTFVLIIAGIDLSVGSVLALSGAVLAAALLDWHWPLWLAVPVCLGAGLGCGIVNGLIVVRWAIPSFIVTLGMLEIARGGAYFVTRSETRYIGSLGAAVKPFAAPIPGVGLSPAFLLAVFVVLVGQVLLVRTVFGRHTIAVGSNEQAARLSGIDPRRVKIVVFAAAGLLAGLGALCHTAKFQNAAPDAGSGLELRAIAAVVIGGTSLMGGRGSVISTFLGVLILVVLETGLAQIGASEETKKAITGLAIIIAVIADAYRQRLSGRQGAILAGLLSKRRRL